MSSRDPKYLVVGGRMNVQRGAAGFLAGVGWGSLLLAAALSVAIVVEGSRQRRAFAAQVRGKHELELRSAVANIEDHFADIWLSLQLIAMDPVVARLGTSSYAQLAAIYDANYSRHRLCEIYVIERDFDGLRRPFMTFERAARGQTKDETHSLEAEAAEYAAQVDQIRRFRDAAQLTCQVSGPLPLCVGEPGIVCSIPIRADRELVAVVSGMATSADIAHVLEMSSPGNRAILVRDPDVALTCQHVTPPLRQWLEARLAAEGRGFFDRHPGEFQALDQVGLWSPVRIVPGEDWFIVVLYDAALEAGPVGAAATGGAALLVVVLGSAVLLLCRVTPALITARHRADTRAVERDEAAAKLQAIVDAAAEGVITIDERGVIEQFNQAAERIFGYVATEVVGRNVATLIPPDLRARYVELLARHRGDPPSQRITLRLEGEARHRSGRAIPVQLAVGDVRLAHRRLFTGIVQDISERKEAQAALADSEARYRALAENTYDLIAECDGEMRVHYLSPNYETVLGWDRRARLGQSPHPWLHPDDREAVMTAFQQALTTGRAEVVHRLRHADESWRWFESGGQMYRQADGGTRITVISRDISARRQAEEALRLSEERLQRIIDNASAVVYLKDAAGRYLLVNRYFERLTGRHAATILTRTDEELFEPQQAAALRAVDARVWTAQTSVEAMETVTVAGEPRVYLSNKFPLFDTSGKPYAIGGISADVTDRLRAEEQARARQAELAHVLRLGTMGEMAAGLAHELNQPLAAILNYLEAARMRLDASGSPCAEIRSDLQHAAAQATRAAAIVEDVRDFLRARDPAPSTVDVNELVREALALTSADAARRGVQVAKELASDLPRVTAIGVQVTQVIVNLVLNALEALEATPPDARRIVIRTHRASAPCVELDVQDTGPGLPPEVRAQVFKPFFTTKAAGMGMGLAISRSIVEAHGGRIWWSSQSSGGATFHFTLPLAPEA